MNVIFEQLAAPFPERDIEWRAGATNAAKDQAMALAYITSRAVMDRLDEVVGPENWKDEYRTGPNGGVICGISIAIRRNEADTSMEWVTKWDGAENSDFEPVKGGLSDAFKRAGYKWGIGRYLYDLPGVWVACEQRGKSIVLKSTPKLPAWAVPVNGSKKLAEESTTTGSNGEEKQHQKMTLDAARAVIYVKKGGGKVKLGELNRDQLIAIQEFCESKLVEGPLTPVQDNLLVACKVILGE